MEADRDTTGGTTTHVMHPVLQVPPGRSGCWSEGVDGGAERDRTAGLVIANDALSQLSYSPIPPPRRWVPQGAAICPSRWGRSSAVGGFLAARVARRRPPGP